MAEPIRVVIIEDQRMFTELLGKLFRDLEDITVVGVAATCAEALEVVAATSPNLLLIDYHLPDGRGVDLARQLRPLHPTMAFLFLSADESAEAVLEAAAAGAAGYVTKTSATKDVVTAVRAAADGEILIPPRVLAEALRRAGDRKSRPNPLTPKEREVLRFLSRGMDNKSLARAASVSVETAKWHVANILQKLDCQSRLEAVVRAAELHLVDD
ncbi:MAG: response regulator [Candidatus Dormibacteria bacterium]